jgi:hypothetical protein
MMLQKVHTQILATIHMVVVSTLQEYLATPAPDIDASSQEGPLRLVSGKGTPSSRVNPAHTTVVWEVDWFGVFETLGR